MIDYYVGKATYSVSHVLPAVRVMWAHEAGAAVALLLWKDKDSGNRARFRRGGNGLRNRKLQFSSVQALSRVRLFATPWTAARQASLSITSSRSPPKLMSRGGLLLAIGSLKCLYVCYCVCALLRLCVMEYVLLCVCFHRHRLLS